MKTAYSILVATALVACQSPALPPPPAEKPPSEAALSIVNAPGAKTPVTAPAKRASSHHAALGVTTGVPSAKLVRELKLDFQVRQEGRLVQSVAAESAAFEAGIRKGDVLVQLGEVSPYSQDDIDDFVAVHDPGDQVFVTLFRSESREREVLQVELGSGAARLSKGIEWQYASLAQLPLALEEARALKKKVLVGLSGAET